MAEQVKNEKQVTERDKSWEHIKRHHKETIEKVEKLIKEAQEKGETSIPYDGKNVRIIKKTFEESGYDLSESFSSLVDPSKPLITISWIGYTHREPLVESKEETAKETERDKTWEKIKMQHEKTTKEIKDELEKIIKEGKYHFEHKSKNLNEVYIQGGIFEELGYSVRIRQTWSLFSCDWSYRYGLIIKV